MRPHLNFTDLRALIVCGEECKLRRSSLCNFLQPPGIKIHLWKLFLNSLNLFSSLNVRYHVWRPWEQQKNYSFQHFKFSALQGLKISPILFFSYFQRESNFDLSPPFSDAWTLCHISKYLLPMFILRFCSEVCYGGMNMCFVAFNRNSEFRLMVFMFPQTNDRKLALCRSWRFPFSSSPFLFSRNVLWVYGIHWECCIIFLSCLNYTLSWSP